MRRVFATVVLGVVASVQGLVCSGSDAKDSQKPLLDDAWYRRHCRCWSPHFFFDGSKVIDLCKAIAEKDYQRIERLVKVEEVDINATGRMNMTPHFWAFPLGYAEAFEKIPRDAMGGYVDSEVIPTLRKFMGEHARLLEHLLKLGADPNIRTTRGEAAEMFKEGKPVIVPAHLFQVYEGFAVTHLAAQPLTKARFNYFPIIMANGGDPNLLAFDGRTPILVTCGLSLRLEGGWSSPENVAILVNAGANLEVRDSDGCTPILKAAEYSHFDLVYMLINAGVDFRAKNESGDDLASFARKRTALEIDPYFLEVVEFLKKEGMLPQSIHEQKASGRRDAFVDEWVAKRQELRKSQKRNTEVPTVEFVK